MEVILKIFQSVKSVSGGILSGEPEPVMRVIQVDYDIIGEAKVIFMKLIDKINTAKIKIN